MVLSSFALGNQKGNDTWNSRKNVIGDVPAIPNTEVNRGIVLTLSTAMDNLKSTLEIDVTI